MKWNGSLFFMSLTSIRILLFAFFLLVTISYGRVVTWNGGSGLWLDASAWHPATVPGSNDIVNLNVSKGSHVYVAHAVEIKSLWFSGGGTLYLSPNSTFNVTTDLIIESGTIECRQEIYFYNTSYGHFPLPKYATVVSMGQTSLTTSARKHLRFLRWHQTNSQLHWDGGNVILTNSTILIEKNANFTIKSSDSILQADTARIKFDVYTGYILNTQSDLILSYPPKGAVLDIVVPNTVHITSTRNYGAEIFPLLVSQDVNAIAYYENQISNLQFGYRHPLYNATINGIDYDHCASICVDSYYSSLCKSFDYFVVNSTCKISLFGLSQVGGLSHIQDYSAATNKSTNSGNSSLSNFVYHYEKRSYNRGVDSYLLIEGKATVACSPFEFATNVVVSGRMNIEATNNVTFDYMLSALPLSEVVLQQDATMTLNGANSSFILHSNANISRTLTPTNNRMQLIFSGGYHFLNGTISSAFNILAENGAYIHIYKTVESGQTGSMESYFLAEHLKLESNSLLYLSGTKNYLTVTNMSLFTAAKIVSNYLDLTVSNMLFVGANCSISASGLGYNHSSGPGAGSHNVLGGSGGSHGGRGGPSIVDASGVPYDSVIAPSEYGSGGGAGYYPESPFGGGQGGGVIIMRANTTYMFGKVTSNGNAGVTGGGGGAGGSIFLSSKFLGGNGFISANGGDGGYEGGLISGGGGSGGRIAIHANQFAFNGSFSNYGGYRYPTYNLPASLEAAAAGTTFIASDSFKAILVSDQLVSGYLTFLESRSAKPTREVLSPTSSNYRAAVVYDNITAFGLSWECNIDLHIVGAAPLSLQSPSFCLNKILGGGEATLLLENGISTLFEANSVTFSHTSVKLLNGSLYKDDYNVTVQEGASMALSTNNDKQSQFNFFNVMIEQDGSLEVLNSTSLSAKYISFSNGSKLELNEKELNFSCKSIILNNMKVVSTGGLGHFTLAKDSLTEIENSLMLTNTVIHLAGTLNQTSSARIEGTVSSVIVENSALLVVSTPHQLDILVPFYSQLGSQAEVHGILSLQGGGVALSGASLYTSLNGTIVISSASFTIESSDCLQGTGNVKLLQNGVLYPPQTLSEEIATITVSYGGVLLVSSSTNYNFTNLVQVENGGMLKITSNSTLFLSNFDLRGGEIYLETFGELHVAANNSKLRSGRVQGQGSIVIAKDSSLQMLESYASNHLLVLETQIYNYGKLIFLDAYVEWARYATLSNYGIVMLNGTQTLAYNQSLFSFEQLSYRLRDAPMEGSEMAWNITSEACASRCLYDNIYISSTSLAGQQIETFGYTCEAFIYNMALQACKLMISKFDDTSSFTANASDWRSWQLFNIVEKWTKPPVFRNLGNGVIQASAADNTSFEMAVVNWGNIIVETGSTVHFAKSFNQSVNGILYVNGKVELEGSAILSGSLTGSGYFYSQGNLTSAASKIKMIHLTMADSSLNLVIHSIVEVYENSSEIHCNSLDINGGIVNVFEAPLSLKVADLVTVRNNGSLSTLTGLLSNDHSGYDLNITSNTVLLEGDGKIESSFAIIQSSRISLNTGSKISCDGRGYSTSLSEYEKLSGSYSLLGTSGGGHAGLGGQGYTTALPSFAISGSFKAYGSFRSATTWGFPGGAFKNETSRGGGAIALFSTYLTVDSQLTCNGESKTDSVLGGGGGGSIRIITKELSGSGTISAIGGDGGRMLQDTIAEGGGGGGGRIVVQRDNSSFTGVMNARGGYGFQKGAAGTIFVADIMGSHGTLSIVNINDQESELTEVYSILSEPTSYSIVDTLYLGMKAKCLWFSDAQEVHVGYLSGDATGKIVFGNGTVFTPYAVNDIDGISNSNRTLIISSAEVIVLDAVLNASTLFVEHYGTVSLTQLGGTGYVNSSHYEFENVTVHGQLIFDYTTSSYVDIDTRMPVELVATIGVYIGQLGKIQSDGQGRMGRSLSNPCPSSNIGCGISGELGGSGGSYGGLGGVGFSSSSSFVYGSILSPIDLGSGGGGCFPSIVGGAGGGAIYINTTEMIVDGGVTANGLSGTGSGAGGGSGGSISITTTYFTNRGFIQANGGDGLFSDTYFGGSGAGGRIFISCEVCNGDRSFNSSSPVLNNVTAYGGGMQYDSLPGSRAQSPVWASNQETLANWVASKPMSGGSGTVVMKQMGNSTLLVKNRPAVVLSVHKCAQLIVNSVYSVNCSKVFFTTSNGVCQLESSQKFSSARLLQNAHLILRRNVNLTISDVKFDDTSTLDIYGVLELPKSVTFSHGNLNVFGQVIGAQELNLNEHHTLSLSPNCTWKSKIEEDSFSVKYFSLYQQLGLTPSLVNISTLVMTSGAGLKFLGGSEYTNYRLILECGNLTMSETNTFISAAGLGFSSEAPGKTSLALNDTIVLTSAASGNVSCGDGGWHAGRGGGYYYDYPASGHALYPLSFGAAGGSTFEVSGSPGGGAIRLVVRNHAIIHGSISADGENCDNTLSSSEAGAGAGGSVWIEVTAGALTGNGTISAIGGDGCTVGGGAGSGGRIALYTNDGSFSNFDGKIYVNGGQQNVVSTGELVAYEAAGGTVIISDVNRLNSKVVSSNNGNNGSDAYFTASCNYPSDDKNFIVGQVFSGDVNLIFPKCNYVFYGSIASLSYSPVFSSALNYASPSLGVIEIIQNASVVITTSLDIVSSTLKVLNSFVAFQQNATIGPQAKLQLSTFGAKLTGSSDALLTSFINEGMEKAQMTIFFNTTAYNEDLSSIYVNNFTIHESSEVKFISTSRQSWTKSNLIEATTLIMNAGSSLLASSILENIDLSWSGNSSVSYFGIPSSVKKGASGGGHAGEGVPGTYGTATASAMGFALFPVGPGGPGGNDLGKQAFGGKGGGGLHLVVHRSARLDGTIDVSGGDASLNTTAGGGAGGSIYIDSPRAVITGTGVMRANGGNGGISENNIIHGGSGSGGFISIRACVDWFQGTFEAKGGLTLGLPSWLPAFVSTKMYQKIVNHNFNTNFFPRIQKIIAAAGGFISRSANESVVISSIRGVNFSESQCVEIGLNWTSPHYSLNYLGMKSWVLSDLLADNSVFVRTLLKSIDASTTGNLSQLVVDSSNLFLPTYHNISSLSVHTTELVNSRMNIVGNGKFAGVSFSGDESSVLTFSDRMYFTPSSTLAIKNFTMNFTENSCLEKGHSLEITDAGQLQVFNVNFTEPSIAFPNDIYAVYNHNCSLDFKYLTMSNNARLVGSKILGEFHEVMLSSNSSISASGYGPYGGISGASPTNGQGKGGGVAGTVGGNGGSYGGKGKPGLATYHRYIDADQYLGEGNEVIVLNDGSFDKRNIVNGSTYGNYWLPIQMGSGGGGDHSNFGYGGRGGGSIILHVGQDIILDEGSSISADGESVYGGGGAGSGGSIWIRHNELKGAEYVEVPKPTIIYVGNIFGGGSITADGGSTCPHVGCAATPDYPGGFGGGGRIRLEKVMESFTGTVSTRSGARNQSADLMEMSNVGSIVRIRAISTLILNKTNDGQPALDVVFTQIPRFIIQVITTKGNGSGERNATNATDAVVKGYWTLGYRAKAANDVFLSSQATAGDVKAVLQSFGYAELDKISVARRPSSDNGWSWSITFLTYPDRIVPIDVDGSHLYCTSGVASIEVTVLNQWNETLSLDYLADSDSPANYTGSELQEILSLSDSKLLTNSSSGYWRNIRTLRILPGNRSDYDAWKRLEEDLYLASVPPIPTLDGFVTSLSPPYLLEFYDPNWKFPTSLPTGLPSTQPSMQPSGQPSIQPSRQPSSQPSGQPSSQPSMQPSGQPSSQPSMQPSSQPSAIPSMQPSSQPTMQPSGQPSSQPSMQPSAQPTSHPSMQPSTQPSALPTMQPSSHPSMQPSTQPTSRPTGQPSSHPSMQPSVQPTSRPTMQPSVQPTSRPTMQPSSHPSMQPSVQPSSRPTGQPSSHPSMQPSVQPTSRPTMQPTSQPSSRPTLQPFSHPTMQPSVQPTSRPTCQPSSHPSMHPSCQPSSQPTNPTSQPSSQPTNPTTQPTTQPTFYPSSQPTMQPSEQPTSQPTQQPTNQPSTQPTLQPTCAPSMQPSGQPTGQPSIQPSGQPSIQPSIQPSVQPSMQPTGRPSMQPSGQPSRQPTSRPTRQPTEQPTARPSVQPSNHPTSQPSDHPTMQPSVQPSGKPSMQPSIQPTGTPSVQPTEQPSSCPSSQPSMVPTMQPSMQPSSRPSSQPTSEPSKCPSAQPSAQPSTLPTHPSSQPSSQPSSHPSSSVPSERPINKPTSQPSAHPTEQPSVQPTAKPSDQPSGHPSAKPSVQPSRKPSQQITADPSTQPSDQPTSRPSNQPIANPSSQPSDQPTSIPTIQPSVQPSGKPSHQPSSQPSGVPSQHPSSVPSSQPVLKPSAHPSDQPTSKPSMQPTTQPTSLPSLQPDARPTTQPTSQPSSQPSVAPISDPTMKPSTQPTVVPSDQPTSHPSSRPSDQPSLHPSDRPSDQPSSQPSTQPTDQPTDRPSSQPSDHPSSKPSIQPTDRPSEQPVDKPTSQPSDRPTDQPTGQPSDRPTDKPSDQPSKSPSDQPSCQPSDHPTSKPSHTKAPIV